MKTLKEQPRKIKPELEELLEEIESLREGEHWSLNLDQVLMFLHVEKEEYFRLIYRLNGAGADLEPVDEFGPESVTVLVEFLSALGYPAVDEVFWERGYYFNDGKLLDWYELFISVVTSRMYSATVDRDLLDTAIAGCMHFEDALLFYCEAHFVHEELIEFALNVYFQRYPVENHHLSRNILLENLARMIKLRMIRWENFYLALYEELRFRALQWGLIQPGEGAGARTSDARYSRYIKPEVRAALEALGLSADFLPSREKLQGVFRSLIKQYHPDLNPEGHEITRRLNEAYALLLVEVGRNKADEA